MNATRNDMSPAYLEARTQQAALGHQLFELMIKDCWYAILRRALRSAEAVDRQPKYTYRSHPDFGDTANPYDIGGLMKLDQARRYKGFALGARIDDDQLKELVEEVLRDELDKYNVELAWTYRTDWEGQDRVLCVYPRL